MLANFEYVTLNNYIVLFGIGKHTEGIL